MEGKLLLLVLFVVFKDCTAYCSSSSQCSIGYVCCSNMCRYGSSCAGYSCISDSNCASLESCCGYTCYRQSTCYGKSCSYDQECNSGSSSLSCCYGYCRYYCNYGLGVAAITGIVCGVIVFISAVTFIIIMCCRRRRNTPGYVTSQPAPRVVTAVGTTTTGYAYQPLQGQPPPQYGAFAQPSQVRVDTGNK